MSHVSKLTSLACLSLACFALESSAYAGPEKKDAKQDASKDEARPLVIFAERVFTAAGSSYDGGMVVTNGKKIALVSPNRSGSDETGNRELRCFAVTPGLIDCSARITSGLNSVEQSREVTPELRVADTLDPFAVAWDGQVRCGVTTVLVNPPDQNVIGGLGVALKTAGPESIAARTLKADAVLRGALGTQPSRSNHPAFGRPTDFYSRRPTTRMAVEWEWRKAFFDAAASTSDAAKRTAGSEQLVAALKGELTVAIQAWATQDIRTAVFLKEEIEREEEFKNGLNKPRFYIDAAAEAWKEPQLLVRAGVPVVLPPFPVAGRTNDMAFMALDTAEKMRKEGIPFALSAHGSTAGESCLSMQAGYAMRGGLPFEEALAAVTLTPARLMGVADRVGTIEVGKDADLCLWSGMPFEPSSRIIGVIVDGVLRYDRLAAAENTAK